MITFSIIALAGLALAVASIVHFRNKYLKEMEYSSTLKSAIDAHAIFSRTDSSGKIIEANKKFTQVSGYSVLELLGNDHRLLNSSYHKPEFFEKMWKTISGGKIWSGILRNKAKDGSYYWVKSTIAPEVSSTGKILGYFAIRTEMTDVKQEGANAIEVIELLDTVDDEILIFDTSTHKVEYANQLALDLNEIESVSSGEYRASDFWIGKTEDEVKTLTAHMLKTGSHRHHYESQVLDRTGAAKWKTHSLTLQNNLIGEGKIVLITRDTTKASELEEKMKILSIAIDASDDFIAIIDPDTLAFDYLNASGQKLLDDVEGNTFDKLFPEFDHEKFELTCKQLLADFSHSQTREPITAQGIRLEFIVRAINFSMGQRILAIARDVSKRTELEHRKRQFMTVVSHELRTPVTSIKGALSILATGALEKDPAAATKLALVANTTSNKLARLINDIVDMEKISEGKFELEMREMDLAEVVSQAIQENHHYASQFGSELKLLETVDKALILGDRLRMGQILDNLISNAVKYGAEEHEVHICLEERGENYVISVRDFGKGLPEGELESIFEAFYQVGRSDSSKVQGSGLGLAIVKELVESHNGQVVASDAEGKGAVFSVTIPKLRENDL